MIWIFGIATLGLLAIITEMVVGFLRGANEIRDQHDHLSQQIAANHHAIEEARTKTEAIRGTVSKVEEDAKILKNRATERQAELTQLQQREERRHPTRRRLTTPPGTREKL